MSVTAGVNEDLVSENDALRKKVKFLQHIGGVFRQKIGKLFVEASKGDARMAQFAEVYNRLVDEMKAFDGPGGPDAAQTPARTPAAAQHEASFASVASPPATGERNPLSQEGQYWHGKFMAATQKIKSLLSSSNNCENQLAEDIRTLHVELAHKDSRLQELDEMLGRTKAELDALRHQHHVQSPLRKQEEMAALEQHALEHADTSTQLIIRSMKEDNHHLSAQLNEALERLRSVDVIQQDNALLQKQNNLLRTRIHKMKDEHTSLVKDNSGTVVDMQANISTLLESLNQANEEILDRDAAVADLKANKDDLIRDMQAMHHVVTSYQQRVTLLERDTVAKMKAEQVQVAEQEKEKTVLHTQVVEGEGTVQDLRCKLDDLQVQVEVQVKTLKENSYHIEILNMEKLSLSEKVKQLDMLLSERRSFGMILGEVQHRLQDAVGELHAVQDTKGVAARMQELKESVSSLEALESQVKFKDDTIAAKDDEIQKLKEAMTLLEASINSISTFFLRMPRSVEEMERIIVERDAFRESVLDCQKHAEAIEEVEEKIALTVLEQRNRAKSAKAGSKSADRSAAKRQMVVEGVGMGASGVFGGVMATQDRLFGALADDSDDELGDDALGAGGNPRSTSTLGEMYESLYGSKARAHLPTPAPKPPQTSSAIVQSVAGAMQALAQTGGEVPGGQHMGVVPPQSQQHLQQQQPQPAQPQGGVQMYVPQPFEYHADDTPPPPAQPASTQPGGALPPPEVAGGASAALSGNDIVHAFKAFEQGGFMDKDHFKTCVLALGLAHAPSAEQYLQFHDTLDLDTFRHAILLCQ